MVEIQEENSEQQQPTNPGAGESQPQQSTPPLDFIKRNQIDALCFVLRLVTIYFSLNYALSVASPATQKMAFTKAFAAAAATNAFRLHHRMRGVDVPLFTQQFLAHLIREDSAHYLFYCLILIITSPVTIALLPIAMFALFHAIAFLTKCSSEMGWNSTLILKLAQLKAQHTPSILSTVACAEIFLFPLLVAMIFTGKANIFAPIAYYQFLAMRWMSLRNPYTRAVFSQLRVSVLSVADHQRCPAPIRSLVHKLISLVERIGQAQLQTP
uniref:Transmembrane protein 33 homolog n=1 Tax=Globodera pallida TaxID=36090 RepID=A0A183C219_GLOPA